MNCYREVVTTLTEEEIPKYLTDLLYTQIREGKDFSELLEFTREFTDVAVWQYVGEHGTKEQLRFIFEDQACRPDSEFYWDVLNAACNVSEERMFLALDSFDFELGSDDVFEMYAGGYEISYDEVMPITAKVLLSLIKYYRLDVSFLVGKRDGCVKDFLLSL